MASNIKGRGRGRGSSRKNVNTKSQSKDSIDLADMQFPLPDNLDDNIASVFSKIQKQLSENLNAIIDSFSKKQKQDEENFVRHIKDIENSFMVSMSESAKEIESLKLKVSKLESENSKLINKLDDIEQYQYRNDLVISGEMISSHYKKMFSKDMDSSSDADDIIPVHERCENVVHMILQKECNLQENQYELVEIKKLGTKYDHENVNSVLITVDDSTSKQRIMSSIIKKKI
jgi:hypothetical protein